jgi:hypothetical protein
MRLRSGWAAAVLLAGPSEEPRLLAHQAVELTDPAFPECRQPYHHGNFKLETDPEEIARRIRIVERTTRRAVSKLLAGYRRQGWEASTAALVVGSLAEPAAIANAHIRAHALEGALFRSAVAAALAAAGLPSSVSVERRLYAEAAAALGRWEDELRRDLAALGRGTSPWRADEKLASLAAWKAISLESRRQQARR